MQTDSWVGYEATKQAWDARLETAAQRLVLLCLAKYSDASGVSFPSAETISKDTLLNRKTVFKTLAELKTLGLLTVSKRATNHSNSYLLDFSSTKNGTTKNGTTEIGTSQKRYVRSTKNGTSVVPNLGQEEYQEKSSKREDIAHSASQSASVCKKKTISVQKPDGVEQEDWDEYLRLRKTKRAPLTKRALALLQSEGEKAEMTLQEVIVKCLEKSWVGFEAKWIEKEKTAEEESRDYWKIKPVHDWRAEQEAYIKAKREKEEKEGLHHGEAIRRYLNGEAA